MLGKDLFNMAHDFFKFEVLFSNNKTVINNHAYKLGEVLTEFLNYDALEALDLIGQLQEQHDFLHFYRPKTFKPYFKEYIKLQKIANKINNLIYEMPLYGKLEIDKEYLEKIFVYDEKYLEHEYNQPPMIIKTLVHPIIDPLTCYFELGNDLKLIKSKHRQLVDVYIHKEPNNNYAKRLNDGDINRLLKGKMFDEHTLAPTTQVDISYVFQANEENSEAEIFEKMTFTTLGDFVFVEIFKALMQGSSPKRCKNCKKYFLLEKGFYYEYCSSIAPNETGKTCRDVGSVNSFKDKVQNNDIWKYYQRAYKKYFNWIKAKKMTNEEFCDWVAKAMAIRDAEIEKSKEKDYILDLEDYTARLEWEKS